MESRGRFLPEVQGLSKSDASYDAFWGLVLIFGASFLLVVYADYTLENIKTGLDVARALIEVLIGLALIFFGGGHFLRER